MSTSVKDANVEDFLDRVRELDERRKIEDEIRRRRLKEEVALKKKKLVAGNGTKNVSTSGENATLLNDDSEIRFARPVLKKNSDVNLREAYTESTYNSYSYGSLPQSSSHSPSLYKYKDTLDVDKTIERLTGRNPRTQQHRTESKPPSDASKYGSSVNNYKDTRDVDKTVERLVGRKPKTQQLPKRSRIPSDSSIIVIDSSSDDEEVLPPLPTRKDTEELLPPLPTRKEEAEVVTPPKLPTRKEHTPLKPQVPKKKISHFDSISQKNTENSHAGVYIPRPNSIAVMSATAAAKAPQLMRNTVDTSLGERSPDLKDKAKFLSASAGIRPTSPRKESNREELSASPSRIAKIPSPQKDSWLTSALSHTGTTKQSIVSTESKIKMKPLVPNKPNSLIINSEKSQEEAQREAEVSKALAKPELNHMINQKPVNKSKPSMEFKLPELRASTSNGSTRSSSREIYDKPEALTRIKGLKPLLPLNKPSFPDPEALQTLSRLRSSSPVRKPAAEEPEALKTLTRLRSSSPVRKPAPEEPEALQKAGKLKPVVPTKKPDSETLELLKKLSSLKKNENSPLKSSPTKKNFELQNLELLQKSMTGLKKASSIENKERPSSHSKPEFTRPILPRRTHTESMAPVRLPFTDPNATFPTIIRPKTFDSSELSNEKESKKLSHVTKTRTKGPKRRLPKNLLQSDQEIPHKIEDFKIRGNKGAPPPIKSSSRVVSNKLEKRIFSNSELFI